MDARTLETWREAQMLRCKKGEFWKMMAVGDGDANRIPQLAVLALAAVAMSF